MNCLRCGKETEEKAAFCPECLEDMARHPIKPGTTVLIPVRPDADVKKTTKKKPDLPPEELLRKAQSLVQILFYVVVGLLVALLVTGALLFHALSQPTEPEESAELPMGRNYTVASSVEDD